jgi:hypothetical protein
MLFLILGCSPVSIDDETLEPCLDTGVLADLNDNSESDEENSEEDLDEEDSEELQWKEATLSVLSPEPSAFINMEEEYLFEAVIQDPNGNDLDFTEIEWQSSVDSNWNPVGQNFQDTLSVGQHTITAHAALPNGDRLTYAVGGVLVQHPDAGIYAGTTTIDNTINNDTTFSCSGGITITVQADGEKGTGEAECIMSFNGNDIPSNYNFELDISDGIVDGTAALDLLLIQQNFPLTGSIDNGELEATWTTSVSLFLIGDIEISGSMELSRVSLY